MLNKVSINMVGICKSAQNDIIRSEKKSEKRNNYSGKDERATSEQVLDPRTRLILFKLLANGFLSEIDGISIEFSFVSSQKEVISYFW